MNDGTASWIEIRGVPDVMAVYMEIVREEERYMPFPLLLVDHPDLLQVDVQIEIDRVAASELQPPGLMPERHVRDQTVVTITEVSRPAGAHPGEVAIRPDAEPGRVPLGVVFLPDVGKIDVANSVVRIEVQQEIAVADGKVLGHV